MNTIVCRPETSELLNYMLLALFQTMQITAVSAPSVDAKIHQRIDTDVRSALNGIQTIPGKFAVNHSPWFAFNDKKIITPCVVNQAHFISGNFQRNLELLGWHKEKVLFNQTIDAFLEISSTPIQSIRIPKDQFANFFSEYIKTNEARIAQENNEPLDAIFSRLYHSLATRSTIAHRDSFDENLQSYFVQAPAQTNFRVGLEFETGNISSSFRAIQKLKLLYTRGHIDAGVFVTSIDKKSCSCRIWPSSNRNGSFEELGQRNYTADITFPFWGYGFAPDLLDVNAPYLGSHGSTYQPINTNRILENGSVSYEVWKGQGDKEILRRI